MEKNNIEKELKKKMPYLWRVQLCFPKDNPTNATCVAYIDARQVMDRLDVVLGIDGWQSDFKEIKGNLFAGIGILFPDLIGGAQWIWKWDCGSESDIEKEKGESSDAFKRAAVKWGIGRFLYDIDIITIKAKAYNGKGRPCDDQGNILWSNDELTKFCNKKIADKENIFDRQDEGNKLSTRPYISAAEKKAWDEAKTKEEKQKLMISMEEKIEYGKKLKDLWMKKLKDEDKVKGKIMLEYAPLSLIKAKVKFPLEEK